MKLLAAVITYYPDVDDAVTNILQYIDDVDMLVIWENTPQDDIDNYKILLPDYEDKVIYKGTGKNEGIAYPLNRIVEYGILNNYTHFLTMDQDSYFVNFKNYKECVERYMNQDDIGIYSPNINNKLKSVNEIETVPDAITSGSIFRLSIFKQDLFFREDFFIDMVDNEFCYHAYRMNFRTVALPNFELKQRFGNMTKYSVGIYSLNYSAFRIYHIIRNFIVTWKKYPDLIQNKHVFVQKVIINRIIKILLFESDKKRKLLAVYWGIRDGFAKRMIERDFKN